MAEPGVAGTIVEVSGSLELAMEHPTITSLDFPLRNYLKTENPYRFPSFLTLATPEQTTCSGAEGVGTVCKGGKQGGLFDAPPLPTSTNKLATLPLRQQRKGTNK